MVQTLTRNAFFSCLQFLVPDPPIKNGMCSRQMICPAMHALIFILGSWVFPGTDLNPASLGRPPLPSNTYPGALPVPTAHRIDAGSFDVRVLSPEL